MTTSKKATAKKPAARKPAARKSTTKRPAAKKAKAATGLQKQAAKQGKKDGPVARVWATCDTMPDAPRRDVIQACVDAGINQWTARTQYQAWRKAR